MLNSPNVKKTIVVYVNSRTRQQPRERWGKPNIMLGKGAKSNANKMMHRWKFRSAGASWLLQQLVCPWAPSMWLHAGRQVAGFREEAPPGCRTSRAPAAQADKALTRNIKEQSQLQAITHIFRRNVLGQTGSKLRRVKLSSREAPEDGLVLPSIQATLADVTWFVMVERTCLTC